MKVFVSSNDKRWKRYKINFEKIVCTLDSAAYSESEVSIVLTDDKEIHALNCQYRNIDKPTNVLSFELGDDVLLGDIYISLDTVMREAKAMGISVEDHTAHMVVHGVLHLMGFDHLNDKDAKKMETREIKALAKIGIKNPYEEPEFVCADGSCCPGSGLFAFLKSLHVREDGVVQYLLYALFGGIAALGFAPFNMWWATVLAIAGAYWLTVRATKKISVFGAFCRIAPFGAAYGVAMFWWMLHSIYVVPELTAQFAIWTVPGVIGLAIAGAVIFSVPFVAVRMLKMSALGRPFMFAATWILVLWLREWLFTGFPWNPIANITLSMPIVANSMAWWGALGLSFVVIGLIASLVEFLRIRMISRLCVFLLFVLLLVFGCVLGRENMRVADFGADNTQHLIRVVQPAINQVQKATHNREEAIRNADFNLRRMVALASGVVVPDLIVFPETAYPFVIVEGDRMPLAAALGTNVIIGSTTYIDNALQNSMIVSDKNGQITSVYSKSHLVPFGEYRPLGFLPSPVNLKPGYGAELISLNVDNGNFIFAPAICYEIIFSDSLIPENASDMPTAIINITNDNWFGNTPGTYQHLDMVRRYAIESGLPIVRANYSGISAFILSDGAVLSALPVGMAGSLDGFVWGAHKTLYRTVGMNWWLIFILSFACIGIFVTRGLDRYNK